MFNRAQEEQHLAIADQAIANAEERIQQSMDRLDRLRAQRTKHRTRGKAPGTAPTNHGYDAETPHANTRTLERRHLKAAMLTGLNYAPLIPQLLGHFH